MSIKMINSTYSINLLQKLKKGTIKGLRFFFIMLILEYAIETFFIFSGAYLGHVDRSEYINWLFIFALFFYLFHYMVNIKFGKTIVSINMDLRNKIYITLEFFLSDIIIPYFLYIGTFYISNLITDHRSDLVIFVFLYPLYGLFVWLIMFFLKTALCKYPKVIKAIRKIIDFAIISIISIMFICYAFTLIL